MAPLLGDHQRNSSRSRPLTHRAMLPPRVRRVFRLPLHRSDLAEAYTDDEIRSHLELRAAALRARGMSPEDAQAEALRRFGSLPSARTTLHHAARRRERRLAILETIDELRRDIVYALRQLKASPGFTIGVVLTFALGIGANAAMFGIIDRLLLRGPEHVRDAERVMRLYRTPARTGQEPSTSTFGYAAYRALDGRVPSLEQVAAYSRSEATLGRGVNARKVNEGHATASFFPLLGVRPALGRFFQADEDRTGNPERVAVLGHSLWRTHFGADSNVVGKSILLADEVFTVVGVAPQRFTGVQLNPVDIWIPMSIRGARIHPDWVATWDASWLSIISRLSGGATAERASLEAGAAIRAVYDGRDSALPNDQWSFLPIRFSEGGAEPPEVAVSRWLTGMAALVLLIVCANIVNLFLARILRRERELAVRLALGASAGHVTRLLLVQTVLLAVLGGLAGLVAAKWGGEFIRNALLPNVAWSELPLGGRVLAFTAIASLTLGVLIGLTPALQASRLDLTTSLKAGVREGGGQRLRLRKALTILQTAISAVLLVGTGLFVQSLRQVAALEHGFDAERVLAIGIHWPNTNIMELTGQDADQQRAREKRFYDLALERIRQLPMIERASIAVGIPFHGSLSFALRVPGWDSLPSAPGGGPFPYVSAVTTEYFATVGTRLRRGRLFTQYDRAGRQRVAVVNETMARMLWPGVDPVGQCLYILREPCSTIVGVVEDARRSSLDEEAAMQYYIPLEQETGMGGEYLLVRPRSRSGSADFRQVAEMLRAELLSIDPNLGYISIETLQEALDWQIRPWRLGATMFGIFGGLALVIAAVGLYSVVAYTVEQRKHELGVRVALGASRTHVVALVFRESLGAAVAGLAIGIAIALLTGGFVEPLLFHVTADDRHVLVLVTLTLLSVATIAAMLPALRAGRADPMQALQAE
jgi:predicted permease